ncbi:MAG TPA: DUF4142 domain-containing protein [Opitutaceae bacterium]|nr:DUF4142 domain-containing protein [Opitutaceae bacterium]
MKTRPIFGSLVIASSALFAGILSAQVSTERPSSARSETMIKEVSRRDRNFLEKAAHSGHKEVAVSQAVASRLVTPGAKDFAQTMISDHTAANTELQALATKRGVTLPMPDNKAQNAWAKNKADDDLDEDYLEEMIDDHEDAVALFKRGAKSKDPEIAAFASKILPKLEHHLQTARTLEKALD